MYIIWESVYTVCIPLHLAPIFCLWGDSLEGTTSVFFHSSCAEQLVLYMKAEECLSSTLRIAKESISQGALTPSAPVKQGGNFIYFSHVQQCKKVFGHLMRL